VRRGVLLSSGELKKDEITVYYSAALNEAATALEGTWRLKDPDDGKVRSAEFAAVRR
jgi:hypothetical protein